MKNMEKQARHTGIAALLCSASLLAGLTGCSVNRVGLIGSPALRRHFAQGQVSDVTITLKQVGDAQGLMGRHPMKQSFLEGFIEGALVEWNGTPASGVIVRLSWEGWANPAPGSANDEDRPEPGRPLVPTLTIDEDDPRAAVLSDAQGGTAVTDKEGRYRVPFSLPLRRGDVEAAGRLYFSPEWGTQFEKMGRAYEPFAEEVPIQLFYYHRDKILAYNEGFHQKAVQLRQGESSDRSLVLKAKNGSGKNTVAELWLDLQLTMVKNRLEKSVALSKAPNGILLALPEPVLFSTAQSDLSKPGQELVHPIAQWITEKRCRVVIHVTPGNDPSLAQRRRASLKNALARAGVPMARFLTTEDTIASPGVTLLLLP